MKRFSKGNLIKLALLLGGVAAAAKLIAAKKSEWTGLSEAEVRHKIETRMPDRVAGEKRAAVADKVVATMKTRGLIEEGTDETTDEAPAEESPSDEEAPEQPSS